MKSKNEAAEILKDLLITQLGLAGVPQQAIRKIIGCGINRVNRVVKYLKPGQEKNPRS